MRELRPDLDRDESVVSAGRLVNGLEGRRGAAHVFHGERLEDHRRVRPLRRQPPDVLVVELRLGDCLLEDGWIRGHSSQPVFLDQTSQDGP